MISPSCIVCNLPTRCSGKLTHSHQCVTGDTAETQHGPTPLCQRSSLTACRVYKCWRCMVTARMLRMLAVTGPSRNNFAPLFRLKPMAVGSLSFSPSHTLTHTHTEFRLEKMAADWNAVLQYPVARQQHALCQPQQDSNSCNSRQGGNTPQPNSHASDDRSPTKSVSSRALLLLGRWQERFVEAC